MTECLELSSKHELSVLTCIMCQSHRLLAMLISIGFGFTPAQAQIGKPEGLYYKSWGVVIGIENYLLAPKIPGAIEDAKTVAQVISQVGLRRSARTLR